MKRLVGFLLILLILPFINTVWAQQNNVTKEELRNFGILGSMVPTRSATVVTGSPYLTDKFLKGKILINRNSTTKSLYLRFNTYKNQVEFVRGKKVMLTNSDKIKGFKILTQEGKPIIFKNGFKNIDNDISSNTFLRIIHSGKIKLLAHHGATLLKDVASYGSADKKNRYQNFVNYYIEDINGDFHKVKLNENDILSAIGDHRDELKSFANTHNLDFQNLQDLNKILSQYEKITSN